MMRDSLRIHLRNSVRDQRTEIREQRSENRDQRSEIRDQRSEIRDQRSEIREQRAERLPLVSFCLMCYNQEKYIEESLSAALNQTYEPLEIIVSDDCSADGSYALLQSIVSKYHGPHKVILHRNERNLGMIKNWENLCRLSHGTLIFKADGDDISKPDRVRTVVADWVQSGKQAVVISSSYEKITEDGRKIGETRLPNGLDTRSGEDIFSGKGWFHPGAASAYHRQLFEQFPAVSCSGAADDTVWIGRAVMSGSLRSIDEILVQYRVGSGTTSVGKQYRQPMVRGLHLCVESVKQLFNDLETAKSWLTQAEYETFFRLFTKRLHHYKRVLKLYEGKTFRERLDGLHEAGTGALFSTAWLVSMCLLLPRSSGDVLLNTLLNLKNWMKG